jgi:uncharacterized glyoxalase superfamily protein PhnB
MRSPLTLGGANSQQLEVAVTDADAHCRRAREAGAIIVMEPGDQFYGARSYRALDPEGHEWSFSQPLAASNSAGNSATNNDIEHWQKIERAPAQTFRPHLFYRDSDAAIDLLERAFGFETVLLIDNDAGVRAHLMFDGWELSLGSERPSDGSGARAGGLSPMSTHNTSTQMVTPLVHSGIDEICERARAAGMVITQEPTDQFYGARTFRALDHEMHLWVFQQPMRELTLEEMSAASGLTLRSSL